MAEADPVGRDLNEAAMASTSEINPGAKRKKLLGIAAAAVLGTSGAYGAWYVLVGSHFVETDNAYVAADTAQVTSMVAGQVISVAGTDTQTVKRGDVLVRLYDGDLRIALAAAEAELAKAKRQFQQTVATGQSLVAQRQSREAEIGSARAQLSAAQSAFAKAQVDYNRRSRLAPEGAVSGDELTSATNALNEARAALVQAQASVSQALSQRGAAEGSLAANQALISGTTSNTAPDVLAAEAKVRQARLDLERTVIRAPLDGVITNRNIQIGQRINPGTTVMRLVPTDRLFVDANFKEGQLAKVRPGQQVKLTSDLYGSDVHYKGTVMGFAGGTGSAFALIPAQNATGNWIKVVQRLPVRIALNPQEIRRNPLRVGLSMTAKIDVSKP